jgi:Ulp1 family protease
LFFTHILQVINFCVSMLDEKHSNDRTGSRSYFFNSFFWSILAERSGKFDYSAVKGHTKKVDIYSAGTERVFFPINNKNRHWLLMVIDMRAKALLLYDSLSAPTTPEIYFEGFIKWLEHEAFSREATFNR